MRNRRVRRAVVAPVLSLLLLVPGAGAGVASARPAAQPIAVQPAARGVVPGVSQLLRDLGLSDVLSQLLAPPTTGGLPSLVVSRVTASTVKVSGVACGFRVEGSGFSPAPDTIVTNAHVVAGVTSPQVLRPDGRRLAAQVQAFDPDRDLAVLSVPGLGQAPLALVPATVGGNGAVFGHPQGQIPVEVSPARVVRRATANLPDIYDQRPVRRDLLILASELEPGDSGGALVNESGDVVGVAFAVSTVRAATAFAVPSEDVARALAGPRAGSVSTGPCLD